ncbi:DNA-3-methyladenine glycosylase [Actinidia chinensis var. chinensis]|uniref:DNA-3-methyladenine glycosylase II n=1 Tax=Actinidia chinensis var. chinensis TaxID=1590841 RepID=A0A2R6S211_ACTCC|nr:DNA-3-methyladenine glycosylase [Actinidia chinensis var. chinensis]
MKRPQRFKRLLKSDKTIETSESNEYHKARTALSSKSSTIKPKTKVKAQSQFRTQFDSISITHHLFLEESTILPPDFFQIDALDLAPLLLGKYLRRDDVVLQITEVEAYRPNDSACHGRFGVTARTAPVFGPGGHAYVYLCYGLHTMLNVVADKEGIGAAVLIRSCAPVSGLETIQQRRGMASEKPVLLSGPGKIGQALGISTEWSNHPLFTPGGLELLDGPKPEKILIGPRVGIEYASPEHVSALWRFAIADTPWISAPKNTLRPSEASITDSEKPSMEDKGGEGKKGVD